MSRVKYGDGSETRVGHRVIYNNQVGTIVVAIDDGLGSPGFPMENYRSYENGILIRFDNGALLMLGTSAKSLVVADTAAAAAPKASISRRVVMLSLRTSE
jgi:hypothetical protein